MNRREFYQDLYNRETDRKNAIENSLNGPIVVITGMMSALFFTATSVDYCGNVFVLLSYMLIACATATFIVLAIYYVVKAFNNFTMGFDYRYLPYAREMEQHFEELLVHNGGNHRTANEDFNNYLKTTYCQCFDSNSYVNDRKSGYLYRSKQFMIIALMLLALTFIPFGINHANKSEPVTNVKIISHEQN